MSCVARRTRRKAAVEQLTDSPALLATLACGAGLTVLGVFVSDSARGVALCVAGTALITMFCIYPMVDAASIGSGKMRWKAHRTSQVEVVQELYGPYEGELKRIARDISGQAKVGRMVREAMQLAYADSGLIPRSRRREHLFCELVALARESSRLAGRDRQPAAADQPLLRLDLDERCAYVLSTSDFLSDDDRADVMHMPLATFTSLLERARDHLAGTRDER
jgi:hypothetical protein